MVFRGLPIWMANIIFFVTKTRENGQPSSGQTDYITHPASKVDIVHFKTFYRDFLEKETKLVKFD